MKESNSVAILDADVASFIVKDLPLGEQYRDLVKDYRLHLSLATAVELRVLAKKKQLSARRKLYLDSFLVECPVIPYCPEMERLLAQVLHERQSIGRPLAFSDALTAVTALFYDVPLVTHDSDFVYTRNLRIITASAEVRANQVLLHAARAPHPSLLPDMRCRCSF
jgi:predicted nucleic acid-binding protein